MNDDSLKHMRFAFQDRWWVIWRDVEPVKTAIAYGVTTFISEELRRVFREHSATKPITRPATFNEFAENMKRNADNLRRAYLGEEKLNLSPDKLAKERPQQFSIADIHAMATALSIENDARFFPSRRYVLEKATKILAAGSLCNSEAIAYVTYVLTGGDYKDGFDETILKTTCSNMGEDGRLQAGELKRVLVSVAKKLGPQLVIASQNEDAKRTQDQTKRTKKRPDLGEA